MDQILNLFKALSDENRLRILLMLKQRPLCVCEMTEVLNIALSTISAHLRLLKSYGLVLDEKDGRWITYTINSNNEFLNKILHEIEERLEDNNVVLNDRKIIKEINRELCALKVRERQR